MPELRNVDRFKVELNNLIHQGGQLELSLMLKVHGEDALAKAANLGNGERLKGLPKFSSAYEAWYSESLAVLKQLLPDRVLDFRDHYEVPRNRKNNDINTANYRILDAIHGLKVTRPPYGEIIVDHSAAISHFQQQLAIIKAADRRFESSLFEMRQFVQADLFDSEIASARELLKNKFLRAAGAVSGVVLEKHLAQVCADHSISIAKKSPGIADLNELLKSNSVIDVPQWRFISLLGDIRNICDHNKQKEPTADQVSDLIDGTDKILKTVF